MVSSRFGNSFQLFIMLKNSIRPRHGAQTVAQAF
jgi:hypothetical protein